MQKVKKAAAAPRRSRKASTPVVETPVVETPVVETPVVETPVAAKPALSAPYLATLRSIFDLGGKSGGEVSRVTLQETARARGLSDNALDTHLYRMRSGRAGTPVCLANDKTGAASNLNERFILLPRAFALLGEACPAKHPDARYVVTDNATTARGASEPGKSYTVRK